MPADFIDVIEHRLYLDKVYERIAMYDAPSPLRYVIHTPVLFEAWSEWAESRPKRDRPSKEITPFGEIEGPSWMTTSYDGLEDFYQDYLELLGRHPDADERG